MPSSTRRNSISGIRGSGKCERKHKIFCKMNVLLSELESRLSEIREGLSAEGLTHLLVSKKGNICYLTGMETGVAVVGLDEAVLWLKDLYIEHHSSLYLDDNYPLDVRVYDMGNVFDYLKGKKQRLGVENVSVNSYRELADKLGYNPPTTEIVESKRMIKSRYEVEMLKTSASIAMKGMDKAFEVVRRGLSEAEAAAEVESELRHNGSECPPFRQGILLASGSSTADIHANPSQEKIKDNSMVIVDLGAKYNNYFSDMTRTITVGSLGREEKEISEFIHNLEMETIDRLEIGMPVKDIHDFVEREIIKKGYQFYHSTGHGVGLEVHEKPSVSSDSSDIVREGMVFTIEPGIYIPRKFGVRFEDMVYVGKKNIEVLTR